MRYDIKTVRNKVQVADYTLHGDTNELTRAVDELERRGEQIVMTHAARVTMDGKPYTGKTSTRR
jgi:hypothetical protein